MTKQKRQDPVIQNEQIPARAGDAAALASFLALTAFSRRPLKARVMPALVVRRHVRTALEQLGPKPVQKKKRRGRVVVLLAVAGAFAAGAAMRRR